MDRLGLTVFYIALSIAAFAFGKAVNRRARHPAANATLIAMLVVIAVLLLSHQNYAAYMRHGGGAIAWLLGPATVALGIPLARHAKTMARESWPIGAAIVAGAVSAAISAPLILSVLGGSKILALSMAPKAVTTPIAMQISAHIGGVPALAALFAIVGGIIVAIIAEPVLARLGITDHRVFGLTAGVAGSGIGAAQAVSRNPQAGAYAALAVGVNAIVTAILVPVFWSWHWL
ncbi:MAG TPA: LrgB family protein [Acidocella sp.]|jgi:putative effector of murein hydrolase|uniref:LrgB family protein n=1 Tax=Acidocella sp. TaxID=50710 RepID=UPI002C88E287|nr:LrgB family protein [Acidocella sp.]HVE21071.1 LrgB family protein [Acidocella sp.]